MKTIQKVEVQKFVHEITYVRPGSAVGPILRLSSYETGHQKKLLHLVCEAAKEQSS